MVFNNAVTKKTAAVSFLFSANSVAKNASPGLSLTTGLSTNVDFGKIFPDNLLSSPPYSRYFYYTGASVIPPCEKNVDWYVFETVFKVD
jgi:carbonic anhydrase